MSFVVGLQLSLAACDRVLSDLTPVPSRKPLDYGEERRTIQIHIEEREPRFSDNSQLHRFLRRAGAYSGNVQVRKEIQ